jgi:hypothetical protein
MRWVPGRVEGVGGVSVEAFGEVAVDVEDGFDAGVPEAGGDDGRVGALGDEEGDVAVSVFPSSSSAPRASYRPALLLFSPSTVSTFGDCTTPPNVCSIGACLPRHHWNKRAGPVISPYARSPQGVRPRGFSPSSRGGLCGQRHS